MGISNMPVRRKRCCLRAREVGSVLAIALLMTSLGTPARSHDEINSAYFGSNRNCRYSRAFSASSIPASRSEEHTSELQSRENLVCRLLLEKTKRQYHRTAPAD